MKKVILVMAALALLGLGVGAQAITIDPFTTAFDATAVPGSNPFNYGQTGPSAYGGLAAERYASAFYGNTLVGSTGNGVAYVTLGTELYTLQGGGTETLLGNANIGWSNDWYGLNWPVVVPLGLGGVTAFQFDLINLSDTVDFTLALANFDYTYLISATASTSGTLVLNVADAYWSEGNDPLNMADVTTLSLGMARPTAGDDFSFQIGSMQAVPEPSSILALAGGLGCLLPLIRRRK